LRKLEYWEKNLIFIWISQFLGMVGMSAVVPFLPLFIRELGVTSSSEVSTWSGLVFAGPFFASFFITPLWGVLGDKYGRKIVTVRAILGLAIAQFFVGLSLSVYQLFITRVLQGFLSGFVPAALALVAANTPKEKNAFALGVLQTSIAAGNIFGPLIGGFLADLFGFRAVFFIVAVLLFATAIIFIFSVEEINKVDKNAKHDSIKENLKFVFNNKSLFNISIMIFLTAFGFALIRPIFVLYFEEFSIDSAYFATIAGSVYAIVGVTNSISPPWWGKLSSNIGHSKVIIYSAIITGLMYPMHYFISNYFYLYPVRALIGIGFGGLSPIMFSLMSNFSPQSNKGGILSIGSSFQILGNSLGLVLGGILAGFTGFRVPFFVTGAVYLSIIFFAKKINTK